MRLKYSVLLLAIALTGCDNKKDEIGCSSEITQSALMDLLKKSAYEGLSEQVDKYPDVTNQTKRSTLDKIKLVKWFTEFGHLNRGDMLTSEQHRCHNEKKKFQRRV